MHFSFCFFFVFKEHNSVVFWMLHPYGTRLEKLFCFWCLTKKYNLNVRMSSQHQVSVTASDIMCKWMGIHNNRNRISTLQINKRCINFLSKQNIKTSAILDLPKEVDNCHVSPLDQLIGLF